MTDQHPGGVAERVLKQIRDTDQDAYARGLMVSGMDIMHAELSRASRAILDELEQQKLWETGDAWERIDSKQSILRAGFERLGLTLTDDDPGGGYDPHGLEASGE